MQQAKRLAVFTLVGAVLGLVVASVIGPKFLVWYNEPGGPATTAMCNCTEVSRATAQALIRWQVTGALIGAVALLILGAVLTFARRRPVPPSEAKTPIGPRTPPLP